MSSNPLLDELVPGLSNLIAGQEMRMVSQEVDEQSFGNAVIEVTSQYLDLRVIRDRGQISIDISPPHVACWTDLRNVLEFLGFESPPGDVAVLIQALSRHFDKVRAFIAEDLQTNRFREFEKQKAASLRNKIFPP